MRISSISSSIASVVSRVIASVVAAGAVRNLFHLMQLREHRGLWLELCQPGYAFAGDQRYRRGSDPMPGKPSDKRPLKRLDIAQAVYTTPCRLSTVRATARG